MYQAERENWEIHISFEMIVSSFNTSYKIEYSAIKL